MHDCGLLIVFIGPYAAEIVAGNDIYGTRPYSLPQTPPTHYMATHTSPVGRVVLPVVHVDLCSASNDPLQLL